MFGLLKEKFERNKTSEWLPQSTSNSGSRMKQQNGNERTSVL
jgi:hypothetical protein